MATLVALRVAGGALALVPVGLAHAVDVVGDVACPMTTEPKCSWNAASIAPDPAGTSMSPGSNAEASPS